MPVYSCKFCPYSTTSLDDFNLHIQKHLDETAASFAQESEEESGEEVELDEEGEGEPTPEYVPSAPVSSDNGESPGEEFLQQVLATTGRVATLVEGASPTPRMEKASLDIAAALLAQVIATSEVELDTIVDIYLQIRSRLMARGRR